MCVSSFPVATDATLPKCLLCDNVGPAERTSVCAGCYTLYGVVHFDHPVLQETAKYPIIDASRDLPTHVSDQVITDARRTLGKQLC